MSPWCDARRRAQLSQLHPQIRLDHLLPSRSRLSAAGLGQAPEYEFLRSRHLPFATRELAETRNFVHEVLLGKPPTIAKERREDDRSSGSPGYAASYRGVRLTSTESSSAAFLSWLRVLSSTRIPSRIRIDFWIDSG